MNAAVTLNNFILVSVNVLGDMHDAFKTSKKCEEINTIITFSRIQFSGALYLISLFFPDILHINSFV